MPVTSFLVGVATTTVLALVAWGMVLWYFDPTTVGLLGLILFLTSFTVALSGILTLTIYAYFKATDPARRFWTALRQGATLGLAGAGVLVLQLLHVASWWNLIMIIIAVGLLEVYFRVRVE